MKEKLRRRVRARALRALVQARILLPAPLVGGALAAISPLARFSRYERRTRANLELALGADTTASERARIAVGVRRHSARLFADWLRLARSGAPGTRDAHRGKWIESAVRLDDSVKILERELGRGRGALIVTAHIGNWELLCARLRRMGLEGAVVGLRRARDPSSAWLEEMRRTYGVATLQRGHVVGLLADLLAPRIDGAVVSFFGIPTRTMTAPAALARAARLPLVPVRCVREGGAYVLRVEEPLHFDAGLPRREATIELTTRLNATFERWIREHPAQWAWHQSRWRGSPDPDREFAAS